MRCAYSYPMNMHQMNGYQSQSVELAPPTAWQLASQGDAVIVDVRSEEEHKFVGRVPDSLLVPWALGINLQRNAQFNEALKDIVPTDKPVLFLCRSGKRSLAAVEAAQALGYQQAYSITGGFEGDKDETGRRGTKDGWRYFDLPWEQD